MTLVVAVGGGISLLFLAGCGGDAPAPQAAAPAAPGGVAPQAPAAVQPMASAPLPRSTNSKWIGGIPYDVFYDRPLEVASNQTLLATAGANPGALQMPAAGTPTPAAPTPGPAPSPAPLTPAPAPSTGNAAAVVDWAKVAPIEQVGEEINRIRNDLQAKLNTLGDYNKNWEQIGVDATALAALAGIVERHPGEVSWKANAKLARDLATEVNASAAKTGRTAYDATKAPFDSIVDLLSGNPPAGKQAEDQVPFGDFADRSLLMKRMEATLSHLKSNVNTEARFAENPADTKRRLTVLAALISVVRTDSYDYTLEPEYQQFAETFANAALSARDAVDGKNFPTFEAGVATMQKTCTECHTKYVFGE